MRVALLSTVVGVLLGVLTFFTHFLPADIAFVSKLGVPWLVTAFALGAVVRGRWQWAAACGAWALLLAVGAYYAGLWAYDSYGSSPIGVWWALIAIPGGALFAALGALWRDGSRDARVAAAGVLGGALIGEAVLFAFMRPGLLIVPLALAGLAAPLLLLRTAPERGRAFAVAAACAVIAAPAVGAIHVGLQVARSAAHALSGGYDY